MYPERKLSISASGLSGPGVGLKFGISNPLLEVQAIALDHTPAASTRDALRLNQGRKDNSTFLIDFLQYHFLVIKLDLAATVERPRLKTPTNNK